MGMYDEICFVCPKCKEAITFQSKAGDRTHSMYSIDNAPLSILMDLNEEGNKENLYCDHCHAQLEAPITFKIQIKETSEADNENWRTA